MLLPEGLVVTITKKTRSRRFFVELNYEDNGVVLGWWGGGVAKYYAPCLGLTDWLTGNFSQIILTYND